MTRGYRDEDPINADRVFDQYDPDDFERPYRRAKAKPDEGVLVRDVEVVRVTDDAMLCRGRGLSSDPFGLEDENDEQWIPRSQVHESSGIPYDAGPDTRGDLVVTTWIAGKKGIKPTTSR